MVDGGWDVDGVSLLFLTVLLWQYSHGQVGMTTFGLSGPGGEVMEYFGFTTANVVAKAQKVRLPGFSLGADHSFWALSS